MRVRMKIIKLEKKITWYKNIGMLNRVLDNDHLWYSLYLKYRNVVNI
jgi:hypothetical protein